MLSLSIVCRVNMHDVASKALESFSLISGVQGGHHHQMLQEGMQQYHPLPQQPQQQQQQQHQQQPQQYQQQQYQQQPQQQYQQYQLPPPPRSRGLAGGGEFGSSSSSSSSSSGNNRDMFGFLAPLPPPRPAPEWGTSHRYFGSEATRVPFDRGELEYLRVLLEENPHMKSSSRMVAMALAHIRRDRAARAIFHVRHVYNTTRLKTGFAALVRTHTAAREADPWGSDDDGDDDAGVEDSPPPTGIGNRLRFFND